MAISAPLPRLDLTMSLDQPGATADATQLDWPQPALPPEPDPDGPHGNHGEVICGACWEHGWLMSMNDRGFLIRHPRRAFPCRAPLEARPLPERVVAEIAMTN